MGDERDARERFDPGRRGCLAGIAAGLTVGARAQEKLRIRYGGDRDFAPFEWLDLEGRPQGFQVELLGEVARELGADLTIELQPWSRTEAAFREGQLDLLAMVDTPPRREWASFARSHATPAFAIYQRRERAEPQDLQDLTGRRVAVIDGEAMRHTVQVWLAGASVDFVPAADAAQALMTVQQGRADAALMPRAYGDRALEAGAAPHVVASKLSLRLQAYAFAVPPGREELRERVQAVLDTLERNGRLEALRTRWLSSHRGEAERSRLSTDLEQQQAWTWGLGGASAVALFLVGAAARRRERRVAAERERRREAEAALARAEELLERTFLRNAQPMLVVERSDGMVRDANEAVLALLCVEAAALVGQSLAAQSRLIDGQALARLVESLDRLGGLDAVPLRVTRADGAVRDCLVSAQTMRIGEREQVFCVLRDITDDLQRDADLRAGYEELELQLAVSLRDRDAARRAEERATQTLDEFTRVVSHDLRTPLNAVQGFAGLLRSRLRSGHVNEAVEFSYHIEMAARRMNSMIGALARLARVAREPLQRRSVDMGALAREAWTLLAAAQPERRVDCRIEALPSAQADPDLAAQVWQNLLDNAWKYSAKIEDARVLVDSYRDDRGTWYRVTDNGAGFDSSRATRLFQPFQRMHSAQQFAGSGVGLSLVRRIVDHHGGEIRLRSAPGVGTVVEFTLDPEPSPS